MRENGTRRAISLRAIAIILLIIMLAGCGGLAGEPRIVASLPAPTAAPTEIGYPLAPPDMARGAAIYAANCVRCHGATGAGDGELVQSGEVSNPADFTDPATASRQRPSAWFDTITHGRIEKLMPPWRDALTEEERWAVAFYTYTLHYDPAEFERGAAIWVEDCVECHGESGRGDGERAAELTRDVGDLTDLATVVSQSDQVYYTIISEGAGENMPAFMEELSEEELRAVAHYTRTLALNNVDVMGQQVVQPIATEEANAVEQPNATDELTVSTITISGQVTNGTVNSTVPADQEIVLFTFDASFNQTQTPISIGADGRYSFADLAYDPASVYVVTTNYRERVFASEVRRGAELVQDAADGSLDLPLTIYELTEDPAVIEITGMVSQVSVVGDSLEVAQVMTLTNTSDRAFSSSQMTEDGRNISIVISLPPGSVIAGLPEEQRYVVASEQFSILDTVPVLPGEEHLVQVIYLIPYENEAIIEQPMNYAVNGAVRLLINPPNINVISDQLQPLGTETLSNMQFASYGAELTLNAGEAIRYDLRGAGLEISSGGAVTSNNLPVIILLFLGFVSILIAVSYLLYYRTKTTARTSSAVQTTPQAGTQALVDAMIAQIAALDAQHEAGEIADNEYQRQRDALKKRLANLMEGQ